MIDLISRAVLLNDLSYCAPELWQNEEYIKAKIMKQPAVDAIPIDFLMRYAQLPTEFAIEAWRKPQKEALKRKIRDVDKPISFDDSVRIVDMRCD